MQPLRIIYISLSGNTADFVNRLSQYIEENYHRQVESLNIKELYGKTFEINSPYVSFLPSYLEGGNGLDNGYQEILTTNLRHVIAHGHNAAYCYGIVGSGNRNFNKQFCLTAYQYSASFGFPVLDEFELRGTQEDIERIAERVIVAEHQFQKEEKSHA